MKYKVGDKVKIKSLDWYNENKNKDGDIRYRKDGSAYPVFFSKYMSNFCGEILTIKSVFKNSYYMNETGFCEFWTDEMIEGLVEEDTKPEFKDEESKKEVIAWMLNGKLVAEKFNDGTITTIIDKFKYTKVSIDSEFCDDKVELVISPDFELKQEGDKWFAIKKKKEYPKTYEECCVALEYIPHTDNVIGYKWNILQLLQKLLICRDAYWKIAGEEMGLDGPWEPDWTIDTDKYVIYQYQYLYLIGVENYRNTLLAFPTKEMRDAFYENFKDLIVQCKELL